MTTRVVRVSTGASRRTASSRASSTRVPTGWARVTSTDVPGSAARAGTEVEAHHHGVEPRARVRLAAARRRRRQRRRRCRGRCPRRRRDRGAPRSKVVARAPRGHDRGRTAPRGHREGRHRRQRARDTGSFADGRGGRGVRRESSIPPTFPRHLFPARVPLSRAPRHSPRTMPVARIKDTTFHSEVYEPAEVRAPRITLAPVSASAPRPRPRRLGLGGAPPPPPPHLSSLAPARPRHRGTASCSWTRSRPVGRPPHTRPASRRRRGGRRHGTVVTSAALLANDASTACRVSPPTSTRTRWRRHAPPPRGVGDAVETMRCDL